jgi:hypothetical protein
LRTPCPRNLFARGDTLFERYSKTGRDFQKRNGGGGWRERHRKRKRKKKEQRKKRERHRKIKIIKRNNKRNNLKKSWKLNSIMGKTGKEVLKKYGSGLLQNSWRISYFQYII